MQSQKSFTKSTFVRGKERKSKNKLMNSTDKKFNFSVVLWVSYCQLHSTAARCQTICQRLWSTKETEVSLTQGLPLQSASSCFNFHICKIKGLSWLIYVHDPFDHPNNPMRQRITSLTFFTVTETDFPDSLNSLPEVILSLIPSSSDSTFKAIFITSNQVITKFSLLLLQID